MVSLSVEDGNAGELMSNKASLTDKVVALRSLKTLSTELIFSIISVALRKLLISILSADEFWNAVTGPVILLELNGMSLSIVCLIDVAQRQNANILNRLTVG